MRAPHFAWAVRDALVRGSSAPRCVETAATASSRPSTGTPRSSPRSTSYGAAIIPKHAAGRATSAQVDGFNRLDRAWIRAIRGKDITTPRSWRSTTGVATSCLRRERRLLREDMAGPSSSPSTSGEGAAPPGSAFKAIVYTTAFDGRSSRPRACCSTSPPIRWRLGAEGRRRGGARTDPGARAIQQSLNLPAIRELERGRQRTVATTAESWASTSSAVADAFLQAGLAGAIARSRTRPIDLTAAFGAIGNGGVKVQTRLILSIDGRRLDAFRRPRTPQGASRRSPRRPRS